MAKAHSGDDLQMDLDDAIGAIVAKATTGHVS
jgi:predicted nucleic acid-binding protein